MESKEIIEGSRLIAEYLGWRYIPSNDLQGFSKSGWWKVAKPVWGDDGLGEMMLAQTKDHKSKLGHSYYICRKHGELRFWNSLDALVPVIKKMEKQFNVNFFLNNEGCSCGYGLHSDNLTGELSSYDLPDWSNNVFKVIVEFLKSKECLK